MTNIETSVIYQGSCHCRRVIFQVIVTEHQATECNCSICAKKGFLHLIVPKEQFTLLQGEEVLTTYSFNTHVARHTFCSICGIHCFYKPRSHPESIDVNIRCLDDNIVSLFRLNYFDGINWEKNIDKLKK